MFFSGWVELIVTQDAECYANVINLLKNTGLVYKDKIQNIGHGNRRHGGIGAIGENISFSNLFQIFVKKADLEYAKALIAHEKHLFDCAE